MYRSDSAYLQEEIKKKTSIISDYKLIVSQLSLKIEDLQKNSQVNILKLFLNFIYLQVCKKFELTIYAK